MDDDTLLLIVLLTIFGFVTLAVIVLLPVYLFLKREKQAGEAWTQRILGQRRPENVRARNGTPQHDAEDEQTSGV